jgi:hypothetical protein
MDIRQYHEQVVAAWPIRIAEERPIHPVPHRGAGTLLTEPCGADLPKCSFIHAHRTNKWKILLIQDSDRRFISQYRIIPRRVTM